MPGVSRSTRLARVYILWSALRHSLINAFRSSPLRDLALASALHFFIFSCWVMGMASPLPLRQEDMNALRSSPFLSPAWALHAFMRSCCGFVFFSSAPEATESVPATRDIATIIASTVCMRPSLVECGGGCAAPRGASRAGRPGRFRLTHFPSLGRVPIPLRKTLERGGVY